MGACQRKRGTIQIGIRAIIIGEWGPSAEVARGTYIIAECAPIRNKKGLLSE